MERVQTTISLAPSAIRAHLVYSRIVRDARGKFCADDTCPSRLSWSGRFLVSVRDYAT